MNRFFSTLGALRGALVLLVLTLIVLGPFSGGATRVSGLGLFTTVIAPTLYVTMLFVLPLDIFMSRVFMAEAEGAERGRYRFIMRLEIGLLIVMVLAWLPFVFRLLERSF